MPLKVNSLAQVHHRPFEYPGLLKRISFQVIIHSKYPLFLEYAYGIEATCGSDTKKCIL